MAKGLKHKVFTLVLGGGSNTVAIADIFDYYLITGGAGGTLLAGNFIALDGGDTPKEGLTFKFKYEGNVVPTGPNKVVVMGQELSVAESSTESWIIAIYRSGAWKVDILIDASKLTWVTKEMLVPTDRAVEADITTGTDILKIPTAKSILDWWINLKATIAQTFAQLITFSIAPKFTSLDAFSFIALDSAKQLASIEILEIVIKTVSANTGMLGDNTIYIPYGFDVQRFIATVKEDIEATDDLVITADIDGTPITDGVITVTMGATVDTEFTQIPTALKTGAAGSKLSLAAAKTTPGGQVDVVVILKRVLS